jgi:phytoene synthase
VRGWTAAGSYAYCERLTRRAAGNFYHAFRILPPAQCRAICALYAFLRVADDLSDDAAPRQRKREALASWREGLHAALDGDHSHPIHPALRHAVLTFGIPARHLEDALDGVEMDLDVHRYETFAELRRYCYRVASSVGLACLPVWGHRGGSGLAAAEAAGIALQLTNVLRDVGEDAARGRIYLPLEDVRRFGYDEGRLLGGVRDGAFAELMRFEAARAYGYYDEALPLAAELAPPGRAVYLVLLRTYRGLLDAIVASGFDVFGSRVGLRKWYKVWLALRALPVRWGWLPD